MLQRTQAKQGANVRKRIDENRQTWTRRVLGGVVVLAAFSVVMLVSAAASALSLEDVKRMAAAGLDDNTLISIIEKSGDKFVVDAVLQAELEAAGVSPRVIKVLKATSPSITVDPVVPVTGPDPAGPEPLPAGVGNLGKLFAQGARSAKQQFDVSAAAQKRIAEQSVVQQEVAKLQTAFQQVDRVMREFDGLDKWAVLAVCHNFLVEFKPAPNTDEYYHATYCKGAAFNALGLHTLAAPILREVVMYGGERGRFVEAFDAFVQSSEAVSFNPASLADLDKLYIDGQNAEFRDRFRYFLGRYFMEIVGDFDRAVALLGQVRSGSLLYAKAVYALGVMQASPRLNLYRTAVENFQQTILAAEALDKNQGRDLVELGYLALARIAYEAMNYDGALYYYNKVAPTSPRYPQALFEGAWTYFLKGDHRNALGTFHSIASPYYDDHYFPDLWVLESTVYLNLCRYDEAKAALQVFRDVYLNQLPLLSDYLAANVDPATLFDGILGLLEQREAQSILPTRFLEALLANVEFYRLYKLIAEVDRERELMAAQASALGPFGAELLEKVSKFAEAKRFEAGLKAQGILKELENELREWDVHSTEVSIEIKIAEKEVDQICLRLAAQGKPCSFTTEEETVLFLVADDWQFWPFENEYWADEVGNYKSYLGDRCRQFEAGGNP